MAGPASPATCSHCAGLLTPGDRFRVAWSNLVQAATMGARRDVLGRALRDFYALAPGFAPMRDPTGDRNYLDWCCGVFGLPHQLASDAFYDHDTAAHDSGSFPAYRG